MPSDGEVPNIVPAALITGGLVAIAWAVCGASGNIGGKLDGIGGAITAAKNEGSALVKAGIMGTACRHHGHGLRRPFQVSTAGPEACRHTPPRG
jgi:hypothetical protein